MSVNCTNSPTTLREIAPVSEKLSAVLVFLILIWTAAICCGMAILSDYGATSGVIGQTAEKWPADSTLQRIADEPTLLMFVHPQCPCTRASIGELALLMASGPQTLQARVLVFAPSEWSETQIKCDIWQSASAIPGVTVEQDPDGQEARRFGALTSGQVFLYGPQGELQFRGGITAARGHAGLNTGRSTVIALLTDNSPRKSAVTECSVFGCPLSTPRDP
ncbi:MAG: hypothetical protein JWM11_5772 [Planctomycetaceae bacterium]|nr:hypothetical protein [Planctomycetaceae bacterium]